MRPDPAFAPKVATPGLPTWVDVRNIADAHAKALQLPQGTRERFLLVEEWTISRMVFKA
jgi:hypothetical protein